MLLTPNAVPFGNFNSRFVLLSDTDKLEKTRKFNRKTAVKLLSNPAAIFKMKQTVKSVKKPYC